MRKKYYYRSDGLISNTIFMLSRMIKKTFAASLTVLAISTAAAAQEKDFGIWYCFNGELPLSRKLELDLSGNIRTNSNASRTDQIFGELGLTYKAFSFMSFTGSYRFTSRKEDDNEFHPRHKWFGELRPSTRLGNFTLSCRLRLQRQDKTYFEDADDEVPDYYGRLKLKTLYRTPSFPVNPFITYETFARMFEQTDKRFDKYRISAGAEYSFSKRHSVELEYIFEKDYLPDLINNSIISISYNLRL